MEKKFVLSFFGHLGAMVVNLANTKGRTYGASRAAPPEGIFRNVIEEGGCHRALGAVQQKEPIIQLSRIMVDSGMVSTVILAYRFSTLKHYLSILIYFW